MPGRKSPFSHCFRARVLALLLVLLPLGGEKAATKAAEPRTSDRVKPRNATVSAAAVLGSRTQPTIGMNVSGAEYSWSSFATPSDLDLLQANHITLLRVPIAWEKAQPALNGPLNNNYLSGLKALLGAASSRGMQVIVDVHNYGRFNSDWSHAGDIGPGKGDLIGSAAVPISAYASLWSRLASALKGTPGLTGYDLMNEPHHMGAHSIWPTAAQAAVNAIRAVDRSTPILIEGDGWASAKNWLSNNRDLDITDPAQKLLYEAHCYFDDGSSRYQLSYDAQGADPQRGAKFVQPFLDWLKDKHLTGFLGEFGVPSDDPRWLPVLDNFLRTLAAAGVSGTNWAYVTHLPTDPGWWPVSNQILMRMDHGQANPQLGVIARYNTPTQ